MVMLTVFTMKLENSVLLEQTRLVSGEKPLTVLLNVLIKQLQRHQLVQLVKLASTVLCIVMKPVVRQPVNTVNM